MSEIKFSRRDSLKLGVAILRGIVGAAALSSCSLLRIDPIKREFESPLRPLNLTNQFFLDGRKLNPNEIEANIPEYARDKIDQIGYRQNDIIVEIFTKPKNAENPDDQNRLPQAVTIKRPLYFDPVLQHAHTVHTLDVICADERRFHFDKNIVKHEDAGLTTTETFYDPKADKVYTVRETNIPDEHNFIDTMSFLGDIDEINFPPISTRIFEGSNLYETVELVRKLGKRTLSVYEETEKGPTKQLLLPGSLWHAKLINSLRQIFRGKDQELDQEKINKIMDTLFKLPKIAAGKYDEDKLFTKFDKSKDKELLKEYFTYFARSKSMKPNKLTSILTAIDNMMTTNNLTYSENLSATELAELVELLSLNDNFQTDFNYTGTLFKTMLTDMIMTPYLIKNQKGLFFHHSVGKTGFDMSPAGWLPIYEENKVDKYFDKNSKRSQLQALTKHIFKRIKTISKEIFSINPAAPLVFALKKEVVEDNGDRKIIYELYEYDYDSLKTEKILSFNESSFPPNSDLFKLFGTEQTRITNIDDLNDVGLNDGTVTEAHILDLPYFWRSKFDTNSFSPQPAIPIIKKDNGDGTSDAYFYFFRDGLIGEFFGNKRLISLKNNKWMTDITSLWKEAKKSGRLIFNNVAFGGSESLANQIVNFSINYVDANGNFIKKELANQLVEIIENSLTKDPFEFGDTLREDLLPQGTNLAVTTRKTYAFRAEPQKVTLPFKLGEINKWTNGNVMGGLIPGSENAQTLAAGEYVEITKLSFINGIPYGQVSNSDYYVPLSNLILEKADTIYQKAVFLASIIALSYGGYLFLEANPAVAAFAGKFIKASIIAMLKSLNWILYGAAPDKDKKT